MISDYLLLSELWQTDITFDFGLLIDNWGSFAGVEPPSSSKYTNTLPPNQRGRLDLNMTVFASGLDGGGSVSTRIPLLFS